jgi:hypothetical protein
MLCPESVLKGYPGLKRTDTSLLWQCRPPLSVYIRNRDHDTDFVYCGTLPSRYMKVLADTAARRLRRALVVASILSKNKLPATSRFCLVIILQVYFHESKELLSSSREGMVE